MSSAEPQSTSPGEIILSQLVTGMDAYSISRTLNSAVAELGARSPDIILPNPEQERILKLYGSRPYHNLGHIAQMLRTYDECFAKYFIGYGGVMRVAIIFHDVVYDATRKDNEEESANVAHKYLADIGVVDGIINGIRSLIMATTHEPLRFFQTTHPLERVICDLDLMGFAALYQAYKRQGAAIRKEFAHLSDQEWREGRLQFLEKMGRRNLFQTSQFKEHLEELAQENIKQELFELRNESTPNVLHTQ